jgi:hypothetical protein
MNYLKGSDIDLKKIRISKVCPPFKAGTKDITKIEVSYGKDPLYIMGAKLYCPFGLGQFPKPEDVTKNTKVKYTLQMNFKGYKEGFDKAASTETLYNFLSELDLHMKELLMKKSGEFLTEPTTDYNIIDLMYQPIIQLPDKDEYDPFFRLKLPMKWKSETEFKTGFSDENQEPLSLDFKTLGKHLENRRWIRPIIKLDCLWYIEGKIYPNIEAHLCKIYSEIEQKKEKVVKTTDDTEEAPTKKKKPKPQANPIHFV